MAWGAAVVARAEDLRELIQGEAKLECPLCELDALNGCRREHPVTTVRPLRSREDAELLVMTERIGTDASQARKLSRAQGSATHLNSMNPRIGSRVKHFVS